MKHLLSLHSISVEEFNNILDLAQKLKKETKAGIEHHLLKGKTLAMIFTKSSTRTRVSFEVAMRQLGGTPMFLGSNDIQLGRGETIEDTAKTLSRYVDGIMIRTFAQKDVEDLAKFGSVPVINGLTDKFHPCQALADFLTILEYKKKLKGIKIAYIGDGNNMCHSLMLAAAKTGTELAAATPDGYRCLSEAVAMAKEDAVQTGAVITETTDVEAAVADADVVYTDTWISMGQESEREKRIEDFKGFIVDSRLMGKAKKDAIFMHCLPAYRGFEVTAEVIDGPQSVVFDQAENRLHAQKAVLAIVMG